MPTFGSLFAGIGGFDLGLERAGWECRWQVEIDPFCRRVLAKHWPDVPKYGDIRGLTGEELERVDLLCGGFPCQDISRAGFRAGIHGERSGLWREYLRVVRALRPRYVLVENVSALLDWGIGVVLGDLAESGYDAEWDCLPAAAFGAPHLRDRVYLVAYPDPQHGHQGVGHLRNRPQQVLSGGHIKRNDLWLQTPSHAPRGDDGVSGRLYSDRVEALGNAVVPPIAEWIGRRLLEVSP